MPRGAGRSSRRSRRSSRRTAKACSEACRDDLHRNDVDSELMDVGFCVKEAEYTLKHMHKWIKPSANRLRSSWNRATFEYGEIRSVSR